MKHHRRPQKPQIVQEVVKPPGLGAGPIAGIVIAVLVVIGGIIGVSVYFAMNGAAGGSQAPSGSTTTPIPTTTASATTTSGPTTTAVPTTTAAPTTTVPPTVAYIYIRTTAVGGNFGNRATTTSACSTRATELGLSCTQTFALLSYSGDTIQDKINATIPDFATNIAVPSGNVISENITDALLTNSIGIAQSIQSAGYGATSPDVFTSYATGFQYSPTSLQNCNNWTDNTASYFAWLGNKTMTDERWMKNTGVSCDTAQHYMCLCYT